MSDIYKDPWTKKTPGELSSEKARTQDEIDFFKSLQGETVAPTMTEDTPPEDTLSTPKYTPGPTLTDTSAEEEALRRDSESAIAADKEKALNKIRTKEALSKLVDAIALGVGAAKGVESPIQLGDSIDTSLDKELMRDEVSSRRAELRDRLREIRQKSRDAYEQGLRDARDRTAHEWKEFGAKSDRQQQLAREVLDEKKRREKAESDRLKAEERRKRFNMMAQKDINREANRISKVIEGAWNQYSKDGDEEGFVSALEVGNVPLTEEDKKTLIDEGIFFDDVVRPDSRWIRGKAREAFGEALKSKAIDQFPMKVYKDGAEATVNNEEELREATSEGWSS